MCLGLDGYERRVAPLSSPVLWTHHSRMAPAIDHAQQDNGARHVQHLSECARSARGSECKAKGGGVSDGVSNKVAPRLLGLALCCCCVGVRPCVAAAESPAACLLYCLGYHRLLSCFASTVRIVDDVAP